MKFTSTAFENSDVIPRKHGRDFGNVNPPLEIGDVSKEAKSLALIMDDPDVPKAAGVPVWVHWVVFNMPPTVAHIPENWTVQGMLGSGTRGELGYSGPRPPDREHRYYFKIYALDTMLILRKGATKEELLETMRGHVLDSVELMGRYAPR